MIGAGGEDAAHRSLQIRLAAPLRGEIRLMQGDRILGAARADALPERRLSLPLPQDAGPGPLTLTVAGPA